MIKSFVALLLLYCFVNLLALVIYYPATILAAFSTDGVGITTITYVLAYSPLLLVNALVFLISLLIRRIKLRRLVKLLFFLCFTILFVTGYTLYIF